ncbi:MAG: hypothetical protein IPN83_07225 [Holophagales bacterium]|nr:hypothetical protein [Holophagales bacterium]
MKIPPRVAGGVTFVRVAVDPAINVPGPVPQAEAAAPLDVQSVNIDKVRSNGAVDTRLNNSTCTSHANRAVPPSTILSAMLVAAPFVVEVISAPEVEAWVVS